MAQYLSILGLILSMPMTFDGLRETRASYTTSSDTTTSLITRSTECVSNIPGSTEELTVKTEMK